MEALVAFWSHALAAALYAGARAVGIAPRDSHRQRPAHAARRARADRLLGLADRDRAVCRAGRLCRDRAQPRLGRRALSPRRGRQRDVRQRGVQPVYAAVAGVLGLQMLVDALPLLVDAGEAGAALPSTAIILRLTAAAGALVLVHNLYGQAAPASRGSMRLAMLGARADVGLRSQSLHRRLFRPRRGARRCSTGAGWRSPLTAPLFALGRRARRGLADPPVARRHLPVALAARDLRLFRADGRSLATALRGSGVDWTRDRRGRGAGADDGRRDGPAAERRARAAGSRSSSPSICSSIATTIAPNGCASPTRSAARGADAAPLGERIVKAFADIARRARRAAADARRRRRLDARRRWNWPARHAPRRRQPRSARPSGARIEQRRPHRRFRSRRGGWDERARRAARDPRLACSPSPTPGPAIPLIHDERLVGLVVLAAPDYRRALDWEDFDLLRTAGRQAASYSRRGARPGGARRRPAVRRVQPPLRLHHARHQESRQPAVACVARNAERHADNPEFRADMIADAAELGRQDERPARAARRHRRARAIQRLERGRAAADR